MGPEKEVRIQNLSPTDSKHPELTTAEPVPSRLQAPGVARAWLLVCSGEGCLSSLDFQ